jgi:hypothetical protein
VHDFDSLEHVDYEQRVLLFCDILGWARFIEEKQSEACYRDKISELLDEVWRLAKKAQEIKSRGVGIDFDLTVGHFSDTFALSCANSSESASSLARHAAHMSNKFLGAGFLCRGAIVAGPLIHEGPVIFGPALVQAHRMESEVAIYPRILVAHEVVEKTKDSGHLRRDADGLYSVDSFGVIWQRTNADVAWNKANLTQASEHIVRELHKHKPDGKEHSKWLYAARRFNDFVQLHLELGVSQIHDV